MGRFLRIVRRLLIAVGVVLLLSVATVAGLLWLSFPPSDQQASIPGLSGPVTIRFDADGVPRIRAANETDAAVALGFVHARDRMFQMDLMRRNGSGRLSEIAGPATLPIDRQMRVLGLRRRAIEDLATLPPETRTILDAYARGVNAWITARGRFSAPEFVVFGIPEPWTPVDSLLWGKIMGLYLSGNWREELGRLSLAGTRPQAEIDELWPPSQPGETPDASLPPDRDYADAAAAILRALPRFPAPFTLPGEASNEWAVDGRHSSSGMPLLAGDPHLAFSLPGIWYLARIETPEGVLAGATAPGVPFLVLGHNGHIAWTFTTTGADTQDVFIETQVSDGRYQTPDGPKPFVTRAERIGVRGQADEVLQVRETRHGPVISDLRAPGGPVLAVAMANLAAGDTAADGLLALNHATSVAEAGRAAERISSPVQNLLVADRAGIAFFMTGRVPIRRTGNGAAPVLGADGAHDWSGWASGDALPHIIGPETGRLVNANERPAAADFPVFLGRDWFGDWRARRIREMLDGNDRLSAADFTRMQIDARSTFARQILPFLLAVPVPEGTGRQAAALLRDWDGTMTPDRPQPLIFNAWVRHFRALLLARADVPVTAGGPQAEFVAFVVTPAGRHWCGGDCGPIWSQALQDAIGELQPRFGNDPAAWRWGTAHQAVFAHPILGRIPLIGGLLTARIESRGDDETVDRGGLSWEGFDAVHGPSFRGVYDLRDLDQSLFVVTPGQSGNPASPHARDFLERWQDGGTISLGPQSAAISATIRLDPP